MPTSHAVVLPPAWTLVINFQLLLAAALNALVLVSSLSRAPSP
jgi:hypothetical protein